MTSGLAGRIETIFTPAISLIARLRYAQKFLLIGVVMIVPLAWVARSYLGVQSQGVAFAEQERAGTVYLRPATHLLAVLVTARTAAVQSAGAGNAAAAGALARRRVRSAVAGVDAVAGAGRTLRLNSRWATLRRRIEAVISAPGTTSASALSAYDGLTSGVEGLIALDGNNSNMILDPDNDTYYLMDAVLNRLPALLDSAGRAGDLQTSMATPGRPSLATRLTLEDLKSSIATTRANSDPDYASALHNTHDKRMSAQLVRPLSHADASLTAVTDQLSRAVTGSLDGPAAVRLGAVAQTSLLALSTATLPVVDHLLAGRIGGFDGASHQTEVACLLGVLLALYLFVGFYLVVRRSQTVIIEGLHELREKGTDPLAEGLNVMAKGDLTRRLETTSRPIVATTRDELGDVVRAVDAIRQRVVGAMTSFNATSTELRTMIGSVSTSAGAVSVASREMSSTSEAAGLATNEIAQAVKEVADGAERQVMMIEEARRAAEGVTEAVDNAVNSARLTAEVGQRARQDAGEGVAAAEEADRAMRAVRQSSASVGEVISELAAKSERIGAIVHTITGIAEQTNLLALNAAIEAARAGEQGRGFAVVAEEVRKLAEESQEAAADIADLITSIQHETSRTVEVVQDGSRQTEQGAEIVRRTREAFERIGSSVQDMTGRISEIATVSDEIAVGASRMHDAINEIAAVAEQSSASTEEVSASTQQTSASGDQISASAKDLAGTAGTLEGLVARFHIGV